ncbi:hypothetical protein CAPTEDRAFT_202739 [Capitella teleta]|uniref:Polycystin cation channel PKD1/PKD2 domain-containing protein n=1 Tax=Capitella teleta TaxID=283909 RepID=R7TAR3_CAPTE|nr:hypothetical protein CAPTEDRAFT_202739 [Capitella teleta]|eukprot:ELT88104.1 hypothetical protein CAPTEDRAFT_202739 [Capitella teleta]
MSDEVDFTEYVTQELPGGTVEERSNGVRPAQPLITQSSTLSSIPEDGVIEPLIERTIAPNSYRAPLDAKSRYSRSSSVSGEIQLENCDLCSADAMTGFYCMYTNDEMLFWPPRDVCESDEELYRKILNRDVIGNKDFMIHEIQHVCRMNFPYRMGVICETLEEHGISLSSDQVTGQMSETPLHVALIYNSTEVASVLMKFGKTELIIRRYQTSQCEGTTALHKAITKRNLELLEEMLSYLEPDEKNAFLHQQAKGEYFRGKVSQAGLPLTLAAVVGDTAIFDELIQQGSQVDAVDDATGNNIIHSLVHFSLHQPDESLKMLQHIFQSTLVQQWWLKRRGMSGMRLTCSEYRHLKICLLKLTNYDGFTPLALSTYLRSPEVCQFLMNVDDVYKFPQWRIGPTSVNYYDIAEIDSSMSNYTKPTVMDLFIYSSDTDHLEFCKIPLIKELMERKWQAYRKLFSAFFFFHLAVMITLTVNCEMKISFKSIIPTSNTTEKVVMRQLVQPQAESWPYLNPIDIMILVLSSLYLVVDVFHSFRLIWTFYRRWFHLVRHRKWASFKMFIASPAIWQMDIFRVMLFGFSVSYVTSIALRILGHHSAEIAMAASLIFGWVFLLCFTRALKSIGVFAVMLQRMLLGDLIHFLIVFGVIIIAFTSAFRILFFKIHDNFIVPDQVTDLPMTIFNFLRLTIGLEEMDIFEQAAHPVMVKVIFMSFVLLANILLLNMLIAAMSDTYAEVTHQKYDLWLKIRTKSICLIEQHLPTFMRPSFGVIHRKREDDQGEIVDLWLLPVEEYAGQKTTARDFR